MTVGYALFAQKLTINGTASIDSTWKVEITNITQKEINGGVTEKSKSYTATSANFDIGFTQPGDYVIYDIEVTNSGTLDAVISNINVVTDNNPAIIYTTSGLQQGDKITKNGDKKILTVKIEYDSNVTSQPALDDNDITLQMDYQQDLGQFDPITYETYMIGDTIQFAGSNWYVIKDSTADDDYVTLMKSEVLTNSELGNYAYGSRDTMSYYYSNTCHMSYTHNFINSDDTGCTVAYSNSNIKRMLEEVYLPTLGENKLKDVELNGNNYKIRLITLDELNSNLGWVNLHDTAKTDNENANVPLWVYNDADGDKYWTMTEDADSSNSIWGIDDAGFLTEISVYYPWVKVRPVINLLKSSIE